MNGGDGLTKYERTWLIKTRAAQLNKSELPMIKVPENIYDQLTIAEMELEAGALTVSSISIKCPPYREQA
jgi:DNA-directed RNA polymerase subunit K/omega